MERQPQNDKTLLDLLEEFTTPEDILQRLTKGTTTDLLDYVARAGTLELQSFCNLAEDLCKESSFWRRLYKRNFTDLYNLFSDHVEPFLQRDLVNSEEPMNIVSSQYRKPAFWRDLYTDTLAVTESKARHSAFKRLVNKEPPLMGEAEPHPKEFAFESFNEDIPLVGDEKVLADFPRFFPTLSVILARSQDPPSHFSKIVVSWGDIGRYLGLSLENELLLFPYMSEARVLAVLAHGKVRCSMGRDILSKGLVRAVKNGWVEVTKELLTSKDVDFHERVYNAALGDGYNSKILLMLLRDSRTMRYVTPVNLMFARMCLLDYAVPVILRLALLNDNDEAIGLLLDEVDDQTSWRSLNVKVAFNANVRLETLDRVFMRVSKCMAHNGKSALTFPPNDCFEVKNSERGMELAKLFAASFCAMSVKQLTLNILPDAKKETIRFLFSAGDYALFDKGNVGFIFDVLYRRGMMDMILWLIPRSCAIGNGGNAFIGASATRFASLRMAPGIFHALLEQGALLTVAEELWFHISNEDPEELSKFMEAKGSELLPRILKGALFWTVAKDLADTARVLLDSGVDIQTLTIHQGESIGREETRIIRALTNPEMGLMLLEKGLDMRAFSGNSLLIIVREVGIKGPWRRDDINKLLMKEYKRQLSPLTDQPTVDELEGDGGEEGKLEEGKLEEGKLEDGEDGELKEGGREKGERDSKAKGRMEKGKNMEKNMEKKHENMTVKSLQEIARELQIKGRSNMRKAELVVAIKNSS